MGGSKLDRGGVIKQTVCQIQIDLRLGVGLAILFVEDGQISTSLMYKSNVIVQ